VGLPYQTRAAATEAKEKSIAGDNDARQFKSAAIPFELGLLPLGALGRPNREDRGLLRAGQDLDVVGHPAYLLPTPRQYLSSEHKSDSITFKLPPILAGIISAIIYHEVKHKRQMKQMLKHKNFIKLLQFL
jgi:hypothetical protein